MIKVRVEYKLVGFNPRQIANKYGFGDKGKAELFLSNTCFRRMEKYVPRDTGALATTVTVRPGSVTYEQPYARRQFYENKGGKGRRGKRWDLAVKNNESHLIAKEVENYVKTLKGSG